MKKYIEKRKVCEKRPKVCKKIADNGICFLKKYIQKKTPLTIVRGVSDYMGIYPILKNHYPCRLAKNRKKPFCSVCIHFVYFLKSKNKRNRPKPIK